MKNIPSMLYFVMFFSVFFHHQTYCAKIQPEAHNLIILLNPMSSSNEQSLAINLLTALTQKASPIMVSPSLWNNFSQNKKLFASSPHLTSLQKYPEKTITDIKYDIQFLSYAIPFDKDEWVIKKIKNVAYVLIPIAYLSQKNDLAKAGEEKIKIPMKNKTETIFQCYGKNNTIFYKINEKGKETQETNNITKQELLLGLKIDHYPTVDDPFEKPEGMDTEKEALQNFDWSELFVTRKDLGLVAPTRNKQLSPPNTEEAKGLELSLQEKNIIESYTQYQKTLLDNYKKITNDQNATIDVFEQYMFPWYIFLIGHGSFQDVIGGLSVNEFRKFISFLNVFIKTIFLFYVTCYGGGQHTDPTFQYAYTTTKNIFKQIPLNLNYTIVSGALTDQQTYAPRIAALLSTMNPPFDLFIKSNYTTMIKNIPVIIFYTADYNKFFSEIERYFNSDAKENKTKIADITNIIHHFKNYYANLSLQNIPLIRFPNTEWFKATDIDDTANIIDLKTINQKQNFNVDKRALLLYEPYIPMKVIFSNTQIPVIPMNVKESSYFFENITTPDPNLAKVLRSFTPFANIPYPKNFYIKELNVKIINTGISGELGNQKYMLKPLTLYNVSIGQQQNNIVINFGFDGGQKPYYYQAKFNDDYNTFNSKLVLLNDATEIKKYNESFAKIEKDFRKKLQTIVEQKTILNQAAQSKKASESLYEEYDKKKNLGNAELSLWKNALSPEQKRIVDTFDAQPSATNEPRLIRTLNRLTEALNVLTHKI